MDLVWLVIGVGLAALGGDRFVRGAVGLASALRIPPGVVGATMAAFATSSPEVLVALNAAVAGNPGIALGDATGANVVNLAVVLGLTLCATAVAVQWGDLRRDLPGVVVSSALVGAVAADGVVSRRDAGILLGWFTTWLVWAVLDARRERSAAGETLGAGSTSRTVADLAVGLAALVAAGRLVVVGAKGVGGWLGWSEFVVGAVLVALATTTPEMATGLIAARRGHAEVGVGAILGSNVFNATFVVGITGLVEPIPVAQAEVVVALGFGIASALLVVPDRGGRLSRRRGPALLGLYGAYLATLFLVR